MPAPSASWSVKRVHATYRNRLSLAKEPGTWTAVASGRIVNTLIDGTKQIFRAGEIGNGALNTTEGEPSLVLDLPVTDDPDNLPQGGEITLTITFSTGGTEVYHLSPLMSWPADPGTDLATLADPALVPSAPAYAIIGVPGGVAELDADGDVIDADGVKVVSGGGGTDAEVVRDTMAAALVAGSNVTITPNDGANTITIAATGGSTDTEVVRDTIATALVAGTNVTITPDDAANTITIAATTGSGGITQAEAEVLFFSKTQSAAVWGHPFDSFSGATNDDKLTAALTYAAAQTYPPAILFGNEQETFTTANRVAYEGMRISGPLGYSNPERNTQTKMAGRVHLSFSGSWFRNPLDADVFGVTLQNLSFTGSGGASGPNVIGQNSSAGQSPTWYCLQMRDIYSSSLRSVIGTQAKAVLLTAAQFDGSWEINNCYNGAFHMGGSDNTLWPAGMLLDSGTAFNTAGSANGQYQIWFDYMEKTDIGPLFVTAEGPWSGIRVDGPANPATVGGSGNMGGPLRFHGLKLEGRNTGASSNGNLLRMNGGIVRMEGCWTSYGMGSPASTGHSPQDAGVIHQIGGILTIDGNTYDKTSSIANTVPYLYVASGEARISNMMRASRGGSWSTNRPVVDDVSGTSVTGDTSVTII